MNYYNEFDPKAAAWLRELIKAGHIPAGDVDERSIEDVTPAELHGYTQCHFFAGIGGWSHALDLAGWPRDRPVWTGSCPCQPFSAAGKGAGFEDERHLWPAWQHLIAQCRPSVVFGEQVAAKAADAWIDLVHADLEGMGYAFGCVPFPAAGVGAPQIRDRNYWMAHADHARLEGRQLPAERAAQFAAGAGGVAGELEDWELSGSRTYGFADGKCYVVGGMADPARAGLQARGSHGVRNDEAAACASAASHGGGISAAGPVNGEWANADWLGCADGKWRAVEPGTFPLADGLPARVGRLRGYGNAIVPAQAAEFIVASVEAMQWGGQVERARVAA